MKIWQPTAPNKTLLSTSEPTVRSKYVLTLLSMENNPYIVILNQIIANRSTETVKKIADCPLREIPEVFLNKYMHSYVIKALRAELTENIKNRRLS